MHTKTLKSAETDMSRALGRIALPCLLFSSVLLLTLTLSHFLLLPEFTKVEVAGSVRNAAELTAYKANLASVVGAMEQKRTELITPLRGTIYASLRDDKVSQVPFLTLLSHIESVLVSFTAGGEQVIDLHALNYAPGEAMITLRGVVHLSEANTFIREPIQV